MAFGKPVVVLGERGFAEVLTPESASTFLWQGFYGLGTGDVTPGRLADLLRPLISSPPKRARLGNFTRQLVESRFSLSAAAGRQIDFYRECLSWHSHSTALARDGVETAIRLLVHKSRQRWQRWRRINESDDFNSIDEMIKVAKRAVEKHLL
jgi:hypothetical protein